MFLIFFMFAWLVDSKPSQIQFAVSDIAPPFSGLSSIALVVGSLRKASWTTDPDAITELEEG